VVVVTSQWFSLHTHSRFSAQDGLATVPAMVEKAARMKQPSLALTDHGNLSGAVQLYTECKKHNILPFIGAELYLIDPDAEPDTPEGHYSAKAPRFHFGLLARNLAGYQALVRFVSHTHTRPAFAMKPRTTFDELLELGRQHGDGLILSTGCFFGLLQQRLVTDGTVAAARVLAAYQSSFPYLVMELQHHGTDAHEQSPQWSDDTIVPALYDMAMAAGVPVMATQDSHYLDQSHKPAHRLMKTMLYEAGEFPGDSYHLATAEWVRAHYPDEIWQAVEKTSDWLLSLHELSIPPLDDYRVRVPAMPTRKVGRRWISASEELRLLVDDALQRFIHERKLPPRTARKYADQVELEYSTFVDMGFSDYLLLVRLVTEFCVNASPPICVETRGSGNSCLIAYLLGITQIDPLKWGLPFERFLHRDRKKPPDFDLDVESERRQEVVDFVDSLVETLRIGTVSVLGSRADNPERGSVLVSYLAYLRRRCEADAAKEGGTKAVQKTRAQQLFTQHYGNIEGFSDVRRLSPRDYQGLRKLIEQHPYKGYGVHPAGLLIGADDITVQDYIPLMLVASSNSEVSEYTMDDLEMFGLVKLDVLGMDSLSVMKRCAELIGHPTPHRFDWIPENDADTLALLRKGQRDNGIFHVEAPAKSAGFRRMKPRNMKEIVIAMTLDMPGVSTSGQADLYLQRRAMPANQRHIRYLHPIWEKALGWTYGAVLFQEQPIQILRDLGMSVADVNMMLKVVKDSGRGAVQRNRERLAELHEAFLKLCAHHGITDTGKAWASVTGMGEYSFNLPHATGYSLRAYRMAYLKAHHPLEFSTALLETFGRKDTEVRKKKLPVYIEDARRQNIPVLAAHVNLSGAGWPMNRKNGSIRKGLITVAGIGHAAVNGIAAHAPYTSVRDFAERATSVTGTKGWRERGEYSAQLEKLRSAGALDGLPE
jgi:DNA polymerase-3 subunit alpha